MLCNSDRHSDLTMVSGGPHRKCSLTHGHNTAAATAVQRCAALAKTGWVLLLVYLPLTVSTTQCNKRAGDS